MKGKTLSALGLIAAIIGAIIIICFRSITSTGVVVVGGITFVAVGVANLILFNQAHANGLAKLLTQIANAGAIVLGICMLVFQGTFTPLVTFIFGLLVAICSLWQFFLLAVGTRPHQLPGWLYIFPLLLLGSALYIFLQKQATEQLIMLITGISIAVLGLACLLEGSALGIVRRQAAKAQARLQEASTTAAEANGAEAKPQIKAAEADGKETTDDLDAPSKIDFPTPDKPAE